MEILLKANTSRSHVAIGDDHAFYCDKTEFFPRLSCSNSDSLFLFFNDLDTNTLHNSSTNVRTSIKLFSLIQPKITLCINCSVF